MEKKTQSSSAIAGVLFVGSLFIGIGLGILYHEVVPGVLLGLGIGFVAMGLAWGIFREK
ncbi:MAG: hypothetical protein H6696_16260 [Deferribacteres bacterium]|nr:hypothetical protein [candidate division KSB1 bacterium]MCB9503486.1 hypothetical protein [Deferribacteres bacterium]